MKKKCQFHQWGRPSTDGRQKCAKCPKTRPTPKSLAKPKKAIKQVSDKRRGRMEKYRAMLAAMPERVRCANCHIYELKENLSPHHYKGRLGKHLYEFVMLHEVEVCGKHNNVHDEVEQATEDGWLQPEFHGLPPIPDKDRTIPWEPQDEASALAAAGAASRE
jgi:hypothetical protein